jgi:hypothetical protein
LGDQYSVTASKAVFRSMAPAEKARFIFVSPLKQSRSQQREAYPVHFTRVQ